MSSLRTNDTHSDGVGMFALRMDRWKVEVELTVVVEKKCVLKNSQLVPKCRHKKEVPPKTKSEILLSCAAGHPEQLLYLRIPPRAHHRQKQHTIIICEVCIHTHLNKRRWTMKTACNGGGGGGRSMAAAAFDGGHTTTSRRAMRGREGSTMRGREGGATRGNTATSRQPAQDDERVAQ